MIVSTLPFWKNRSIRTIYFTYFAISAWFTQAMWYVFFLKVASPEQIALVHTLGFVVGLLMDLPTGYLADRIGRKRVLSLGLLLFSIGLTLFGFVQNLWQLFLFEIIVQIGLACISGALEAVLHDTVGSFEKDASKRDRIFNLIYSKCRMIISFSLIVSAFIGGFVYRYSESAPWFMMATLSFIAFIAARKLPNIRGIPEQSERADVLRHTQDALRIFWQRHNRYLLPSVALLGGIALLSDWGVFYIGSFEELGITPFAISMFLTVVYICAMCASHYLPALYQKLGKKNGFVIYALLTSAILGIGGWLQPQGTQIAMLFIGAYIVISTLLLGYITSVVSEISTDKHRATALSASGLIIKLLYMASAPIMGYNFARENGAYNYWMYAAMALMALVFIYILQKRHSPKTAYV